MHELRGSMPWNLQDASGEVSQLWLIGTEEREQEGVNNPESYPAAGEELGAGTRPDPLNFDDPQQYHHNDS